MDHPGRSWAGTEHFNYAQARFLRRIGRYLEFQNSAVDGRGVELPIENHLNGVAM